MWRPGDWLVTLFSGCCPSPTLLGWPSVLCSNGEGGGVGRLAFLNSVGWLFFVFRLVLCRQTL
jgi:hypothetical protein